VLAICQPAVAALAAAAIMAEDGDPALPPSLTLMAGPIDTRINPTKINALATGKPLSWFETTLLAACRGASPAPAAASIPASCSSPAS